LIRDVARVLGHLGARVQRGLLLDEHHEACLDGNRLVANAARHHVGFAFAKLDGERLHLDRQLASEHEEQFIFALVRLPGEVAVKLRDLDVRVIERRDHARRPQFRE
jgi:hypothetical protein